MDSKTLRIVVGLILLFGAMPLTWFLITRVGGWSWVFAILVGGVAGALLAEPRSNVDINTPTRNRRNAKNSTEAYNVYDDPGFSNLPGNIYHTPDSFRDNNMH